MEKIKLTPKRKEIVERMQFDSIKDALHYFPYRYDIFKDEPLTMKKHDSKVCVEGFIISSIKEAYISSKRIKTTLTLKIKNGEVNLVFFNRFTSKAFLSINTNLVVMGKYNAFTNEITVSNFFIGKLEGKEKINSIYSLPTDIKDHVYRSMISYFIDYAISNDMLKDNLPLELINKYRLVSYKDAIKYIHEPKDLNELNQAKRYLKYEEFLSFCMMGKIKRELFNNNIDNSKNINEELIEKFISELPFKLTDDQKEVTSEILNDIKSAKLMARLLQGDVGSGKTIVAIIAMLATVSSGYQASLMAPTDILAGQHYQLINDLLSKYGYKVELLVSSLSNSKKQEVLDDIRNNKVDIIIGTHSLIQDSVKFANLGLAVVDEQHRFGVKQRVLLKQKGKSVDVLYMSATPIPRTLASTIYMDMDVSTLKAYPYKERKINTYFINENSIRKEKEFIKKYLDNKEKVYVIAPSIETFSNDVVSVDKIYKSWSEQFKQYHVSYLHGKLSSENKEKIINDFNDGKIDILISTTVVEVGINIKDADMMVIYNAERFGLATLHQLRGRLARNGQTGYCYLLSDDDSDEVNKRLSFMASCNDGFKISEFDLKMRGAGDLLGVAQSGKEPFVIANIIDDFNILRVASEDAKYIYDNNIYKEYISYIKSLILNNEQSVD